MSPLGRIYCEMGDFAIGYPPLPSPLQFFTDYRMYYERLRSLMREA